MLKITKIKPLNTNIVTTAERYKDTQTIGNSSIADTTKLAGTLKEYQTVIAVGPLVRSMKEGDLVRVNPRRYAKLKHQEGSLKDGVITDNPVVSYNIPMVDVGGKECLFLTDTDVDFIVEEWEEDNENLYIPKKKIVL